MLSSVLAVAVAVAAVLLAVVTYQLRLDRPVRPAPRHRVAQGPYGTPKHPWAAQPDTPALTAEPEPERVFDPLDEATTLDEVEAFLRSLGVPPPTELDEAHSEAAREDWGRTQVASAGKSWETHLVKFSGAVLPRQLDDTDELEPAL